MVVITPLISMVAERNEAGAKSLGHGTGYDYPHDHDEGWVDQQYRPAGLEGRVYYEPSGHGREREIAERLSERRSRRSGPTTPGDPD